VHSLPGTNGSPMGRMCRIPSRSWMPYHGEDVPDPQPLLDAVPGEHRQQLHVAFARLAGEGQELQRRLWTRGPRATADVRRGVAHARPRPDLQHAQVRKVPQRGTRAQLVLADAVSAEEGADVRVDEVVDGFLLEPVEQGLASS
jgi:hypothetical protein